MTIQVSVCGPRDCTDHEAEQAFRVGELLAERGVITICGGGTGVMAAVAAGASSKDGLVVGIRPSGTRDGASPDLSVTLLTNMGEARNAIIVWSADVIIVIGGSWGTLSELALAKRKGDVPVVSLNGWKIMNQQGRPVEGIVQTSTAEQAVIAAFESLQNHGDKTAE